MGGRGGSAQRVRGGEVEGMSGVCVWGGCWSGAGRSVAEQSSVSVRFLLSSFPLVSLSPSSSPILSLCVWIGAPRAPQGRFMDR